MAVAYKSKYRVTLDRLPNWRESISKVSAAVSRSRSGVGDYTLPAPRTVRTISAYSVCRLYNPHQWWFERLQAMLRDGKTFQSSMSTLKRSRPGDLQFIWQGGQSSDSRLRLTVIHKGVTSRFRGTVLELRDASFRYLKVIPPERDKPVPAALKARRTRRVSSDNAKAGRVVRKFCKPSPIHPSHLDFFLVFLDGWKNGSQTLLSKLYSMAAREKWKMQGWRSSTGKFHIWVFCPRTGAKSSFLGTLQELDEMLRVR